MQKGEISAKIFTLPCLFVVGSIRTCFVNHRRRISSSSMFVCLYICSLYVVCYREGETAGPGSKSDGKHPKVALSAGGSF